MNISGKMLRDAVISGTNNIVNKKNMVDELNVFPVPDGDTGTNMSMTIKNAYTELKKMPDDVTAATVASATASAMLRGARGNSGVILSLLFRGLSKGLAGKETASAKDFSAALKKGVDSAYKSVMKPTEGTILTVARETAEKIIEFSENNDDIKAMFTELLNEAKKSLDKTPELLPVLKNAGVVDAGGMGFYVIMEGMNSVINDGKIIENEEDAAAKVQKVANAAGSVEAEIEYTYCAEYVITKKTGAKDQTALRAFLESIGDSVTVVDDDDIIKVHIYTEHPGKAIEEGLKFGTLNNVKIENMRDQHKKEEKKVEMAKKKKLQPVKPEKEFGFVAVAAGSGIEALFNDLGVDTIVRGGQTMNPSTEDILEAIEATPANNVFVLPNNKNIIMAAEQAVKIADRNVIVLQTRTIPQGITAMLSFDETADTNSNAIAMTAALDRVGTGTITYAVRDSEFEGRSIKKSDIMAMENGKLAVVERDVTKALVKITKKLLKSESSYITVIYGSDVTDEAANAAYEQLRSKISDDIEIVLVNGGQPVYYYIISVE